MIVDLPGDGSMLETRIPLLDFSLEEVHTLRPFLVALGLENRYISRAIKESSRVKDSVLDDELTRQMRGKAYALFRYILL